MVDNVECHGTSPLGVVPHQYARAHVQETRGVQMGGTQMNGLRKIPIRERQELSTAKLEC